jgi:hypothetical protein
LLPFISQLGVSSYQKLSEKFIEKFPSYIEDTKKLLEDVKNKKVNKFDLK